MVWGGVWWGGMCVEWGGVGWGDERGGAAGALEAYLLEDLHAVHAVHHDVAYHEVELLARRLADTLAQQLQAVLAATCPLSPRTHAQ